LCRRRASRRDDAAAEHGAQAEIVGPDSVKAARQAHRYPRPKYAGGSAPAVLGSGDAA
jgi:hypothetical protein